MKFDDIEWLGGQFTEYGSAARAAAGILLKQNGWDWYYLKSRSALEEALQRAIPGHETVAWGGDEAVLSISEWLDPAKAVILGRLFKSTARSRPGLRIRIARDVWEWHTTENAPEVVRADLARALPNTAIFYDWPVNRKPRRINVDRPDGKIVVTSPDALLPRSVGSALAEAIGDAVFESTGEKADIVVATSATELLASKIAANVVIILEDNSRAVIDRLDEIRVEKAARCVVRVPQQNAREWMGSFGTHWRANFVSIDRAVRFANRAQAVEAELVAANQTFLHQSRQYLREQYREVLPRTDSYIGGLQPQFLPDLPLYDTVPEAEELRAPPPSKRMLEATVYQGKRRVWDLPPSGQLRIELIIKPKTFSSTGVPDFPDDLIDWRGDTRKLQVHMVELDRDVRTAQISLPRRGSSNLIEFDYEIISQKDLDLRFMVCDGTQILQTARLKAKPRGGIRLSFEADFTSLEKERKSFDLALMINDSLGSRPSATVLSPNGVQITAFDSGEIGTLRAMASNLLETVVTNPEIPLRDALMQLADVGSGLLEVIREEIGVWPSDLQRVQLTTKDNAFFPLEFLYDGIVPKDPRAPLCPDFKTCLRSGKLRARCETRQDAEVLCPMGFLGLRTVIERKVWSEGPLGPIWLKESLELAARHQIGRIGQIAFAASDIADEFGDDDTFPSGLTLARIQSIVDELAPRLENWEEWEEAVVDEDFTMGILIAHIDDTKIFIGADHQRNSSRLEFGTVPVAILLGCKSAVSAIPSLSLPARIMRRGSTRVVVAALTDLLGRHANTAALYLGKRIRDAARGPVAVTLGEFIVELRRELLADEVATGLILVALGDADIVLGG
ncbi:hypothetical protein U8C35_27185 (plasmid) [Sinorhizobium medicae]|uniref:hypothetical protein n=1 Tax=Sinorhizobium medicae TaxID=110321 RepID=UPI002AF6B5BF|nr:hypothetical protein [Sinorhizobium medicae]WQO62081.1 hypothetical protein U8C35_27185 [Sinorhizobium medicae]